jgi:DNA-directed RNA polymerase subunit RPC12/RpoP
MPLPKAAAPVSRLVPTQRSGAPRRGCGDPTAAAASPSSLVKVADTTRAQCPACGSRRLMQIAMTLTDGTPVRFTSCRGCEHRSWTQAEGILPVESVLTKATKRR